MRAGLFPARRTAPPHSKQCGAGPERPRSRTARLIHCPMPPTVRAGAHPPWSSPGRANVLPPNLCGHRRNRGCQCRSAKAVAAHTVSPAMTSVVDLVNRFPGQQVFAHVTGLDRPGPRVGQVALPGRPTPRAGCIRALGVGADTADHRHRNPPGAAGTRKWQAIPAVDSGRVYFSVGRAPKFFVNPGASIVCHR